MTQIDGDATVSAVGVGLGSGRRGQSEDRSRIARWPEHLRAEHVNLAVAILAKAVHDVVERPRSVVSSSWIGDRPELRGAEAKTLLAGAVNEEVAPPKMYLPSRAGASFP